MTTVKKIFTIPAGMTWSKSTIETTEQGVMFKVTSKAPEQRQ